MKKIILLLLAVVLLLSACDSGPAVSPAPSESTDPSDVVVVTEEPDISGDPQETGDPAPTGGNAVTDDPTHEPLEDPFDDPTPTPRATPKPYDGELVEYKGDFFHVFFHYLIAYPDIAKTTSYMANLDTDCVTAKEFKAALQDLYERDFVLVDITTYVTNDVDDDGNPIIKRAPVMVPPGKKPLVMSFDDLSYTTNKLHKGTIDKIILDADGNLAAQTIMEDGTVDIRYDNEVIPILEAFVSEHPDFSPFGVKGMLALTGFDGILGYRTHRDSPNRESEIEAVKPIIQALKDAGWTFASHSYGHIHTDKQTIERVTEDANHWRDEVQPLVGETPVLVYPFGESVKNTDPKFKILMDHGFNIFCGVGMKPFASWKSNYFFMDRQSIDGYTLRNYADTHLVPLIDAHDVFDAEAREG